MKFLHVTLAILVIAFAPIAGEHCRANDPPKEQPTEQKKDFSASGIVIDSDGNPVPKATIACMTWRKGKAKNTLLKSDAEGKFKISYPNTDSIHRSLHTWAWAKGHGVRSVMMKAKFKNGTTVAKDVTIELPPNETFDIKITDPNGVPFPNATIEVTTALVPNGRFAADEPTGLVSFVPTPISRTLGAITDDQGIATIEGFPRQLISGVSVRSGTYGTQIIGASKKDEFQLVETGSIKGKINAPDVSLYRGMKIHFETFGITRGKAIAHVDDDGTFLVPAIAPGSLTIDVFWPSKTDIFPLDSYDGTVETGKAFEVESASEPAAIIEVSGRVVTEDSGIPVPSAVVVFGDRRGRSGPSARTDEDGNFLALVCEGKARCQLISMGPNRKIARGYNYPLQNTRRINVVGDDKNKFRLPDIKVTPRPTIRGRLIDTDGSPIGETSIAIAFGENGHTTGNAKTDKEGYFEMRVAIPLKKVLAFRGSRFAIVTKAVKETRLPTFEKLEVLNPEILDTDENSVDGLQLQRFAEE